MKITRAKEDDGSDKEMPLMKQVRDEDSIRPLSCKQGANSHKPFHHQIEKQPDQGSKRRSGKDINKGDETHAT
ncbi:hypothetical protein YC2023_115351 [Brassica napus]